MHTRQGLKGTAPKFLEHQTVTITSAVDYISLHLLDGLFAGDFHGEAEIHYGMGGEGGMFGCDEDPLQTDIEDVRRYQAAKSMKDEGIQAYRVAPAPAVFHCDDVSMR